MFMISSLSSSLEFLLADVGAIFVWTEGIYRSTADLAFNLTHQTVVPYLIHRNIAPTSARRNSREEERKEIINMEV